MGEIVAPHPGRQSHLVAGGDWNGSGSGAVPCIMCLRRSDREDTAVSDYEFVTYEELDDGAIVPIAPLGVLLVAAIPFRPFDAGYECSR